MIKTQTQVQIKEPSDDSPQCAHCKSKRCLRLCDHCTFHTCQYCWAFKHQCDERRTETHTYYCLECGIDMGPHNPRQLCGKTRCLDN